MNASKYLLIGVATIVLSACSDDDLQDNPLADGPVAMTFTADIGAPVSRVNDTGTQFSEGDKVGILPVRKGGDDTSLMLYEYSNGKFSSDNPYYFQDLSKVDFHAFYPYTKYIKVDPNLLSISITTYKPNQGNYPETTVKGWRENDFLYATVSTDVHSPAIAFTGANAFRHVMSKFSLTLKAGDGIGELSELNSYTLNDIVLTGDFLLLSGEVITWADKESLTMDVKDAAGTEYTPTSLILIPQDITDGKLPLTVNYNNQEYTTQLALPDGKLSPGVHYSYMVTINKTKLEVGKAEIKPWDKKSGSGTATLQ